MKNRAYVGKQLRADKLADVLRKLGARRVYIAEDKAGNLFSSIAMSTITFTRHAVYLYPYYTGLQPDDTEGIEYNITELE